jgi:hypothetical protein
MDEMRARLITAEYNMTIQNHMCYGDPTESALI